MLNIFSHSAVPYIFVRMFIIKVANECLSSSCLSTLYMLYSIASLVSFSVIGVYFSLTHSSYPLKMFVISNMWDYHVKE
jgi:hypothetical protein